MAMEISNYLHAAEQQAALIAGIPADITLRNIERVAVIGAGTMGTGIAINFLNAGLAVTLLEQKRAALEGGLEAIRSHYQRRVGKGRLTAADADRRMQLLSGTLDDQQLAGADLVIEAVFEDMAVKKAVFAQLDKICKPGAILATNTSTLNVDDIASATRRPQDVVGLHFFSPAHVMRLVEIVRAAKTADDVTATCMALAKTINKVGVAVGVCFGFVANRMLEPYAREAGRLVLEGASPAQVDRAITAFGFPMGPFAMGDLAGLDIAHQVRSSHPHIAKGDPSYGVLGDRLVAAGQLGQKTGRGAYIYRPGSRSPEENPEVPAIAAAEARRLGIARREISDREILQRCLFCLINEGAAVLSEGIAQRAGDIDVIYVYGYGFPAHEGGPMRYAERIGLSHICQAMVQYREQLGDYGRLWFNPSPLLQKLAHAGRNFDSESS